MPFQYVGRLQSPYQPGLSQGFQVGSNLFSNILLQAISQNFRKKEAEIDRLEKEKLLGIELEAKGMAQQAPSVREQKEKMGTAPSKQEGLVSLGGKTYRVTPRTYNQQLFDLPGLGTFFMQQDAEGKMTLQQFNPKNIGSLQKDYEYAKTQGYMGTLDDFMKTRRQTIMQEKPAAASERSALATTEATLDRLTDLKNMFDTAYVGPAQGRIGKVKDIFGWNSPKQSEFYAATAALKNQIIKEITGAQMSEPEAKRIMKQIPDVDDADTVWVAKWKQTRKNLIYLQKRRLEVLEKSGLKAPMKEPTMQPNDPLGLF